MDISTRRYWRLLIKRQLPAREIYEFFPVASYWAMTLHLIYVIRNLLLMEAVEQVSSIWEGFSFKGCSNSLLSNFLGFYIWKIEKNRKDRERTFEICGFYELQRLPLMLSKFPQSQRRFFFSIEIRKRYKNTKTSSRTLLYSVYFILWSYILSKLELYYKKKSFHRYTCPVKWCNFVLRSLLYFKPNLSCREKFMPRYRRQIFRRTHLVETLCTYFLFI